MSKCLVIADVQNLYRTIKSKFGYTAKLNYGKIIEKIRQEHEVIKAIAYGDANNNVHDFVTMLEAFGFEIFFRDRVNWGVYAFKEILETEADRIIILSNDPVFIPIIDHLNNIPPDRFPKNITAIGTRLPKTYNCEKVELTDEYIIKYEARRNEAAK